MSECVEVLIGLEEFSGCSSVLGWLSCMICGVESIIWNWWGASWQQRMDRSTCAAGGTEACLRGGMEFLNSSRVPAVHLHGTVLNALLDGLKCANIVTEGT